MGAPGRARRLLLVNLLLSAGGGGLAWVLPSRPGAALLPLPPRLPWSSGGGRCVHGRLEPRYQRTERSIRMNAEETKGLLRSIEDFFGLPTPEERRKAQVEMMRRREGRRRSPPVVDKTAPLTRVYGRYIPPEECASGQSTPGSIQEMERIRFDALREGDHVRQNEILQKSISRGG